MPSILEAAMQEGVEKGIEKGKLEDARVMIQMGMSTAEITKITGLSAKRIGSLGRKKK